MNYIAGLKQYNNDRPAVITIGKFDGFHLGHQKLLAKVDELVRTDHVASVVIAFDMIPLLQAKGLLTGVLMERSEKRLYLDGKVDFFVDCPFDETVSEMAAEDFIRDELAGRFHARHLVVGEDFRFGKDRRGDIDMLSRMADECGYTLHVVPAVYRGSEKISSRYIKEDLVEGKILEVNEQLGHPWQVRGTINFGKSIAGKKLDMPTINVIPDPVKALPPYGVYAVSALIDGKNYDGVANIGIKPTVSDEQKPVVEVHLYDFDQNVYGEDTVISFYSFLRPEKKFESLEALKEQMHRDAQAARAQWQQIRS